MSGGWLHGWCSFCSKLQIRAVEGQTQKLQIWRPAGTSGGRNVPKPRQLSNLFLGRGAVQGARDGLKEFRDRPRESRLPDPSTVWGQRSTSASSPSAWRGHSCSPRPPGRRAAAGTFPLLSRPHAPPLARTKTRAASRPSGSRRSQAPITRPPAGLIGPRLAGPAPIGWRRRTRPLRGAVYFGLPARPAPGRSLRGAPPLPRLAGRAEAEPRAARRAEVRAGCRRSGRRRPPAAHVQPPPRAELPIRSFVLPAGRRAPCTRRAPPARARRAR